MKKVMSVLAALMMVFSAFAFDVNSTFGMKQQDSPEGYQQYVGKQFQFRYPSGKLETWEKSEWVILSICYLFLFVASQYIR